MTNRKNSILGLKVIEPKRFYDERGYFSELHNDRSLIQQGIDIAFVQDNHSVSFSKNTVRGIHFQAPPNAQDKIVRCGNGSIFDVAVDIRTGSKTYGCWFGIELSADNGKQLFIPKGFAHGFMTLSDHSEIVYKCSDFYSPENEGAILWNDPTLGIEWGNLGKPKLSEKDLRATEFSKFKSPFFYGVNS